LISGIELPAKSTVSAFYMLLVLFYGSCMYSSLLQKLIEQAKWLPFLYLFFLSIKTARYGEKSERLLVRLLPMVVAVPFLISSLQDPSKISTWFYAGAFALAIFSTWQTARCIRQSHTESEFYLAIERIGSAVIISAALMSVLGISLGRAGRFSAWTDNPNTLGLIISPTIVVCAASLGETGGRRIMRIAMIVLGAILLVQTGSRASIFWVAGSFGAMLFARRPVGFILVSLALLVLVSSIGYDNIMQYVSDFTKYRDHGAANTTDPLSGRTYLWAFGLDLALQHPWLGYGPGSEEALVTQNPWIFLYSEGTHFHNSYLSALIQSGVVGLSTLLFGTITSLTLAFRRIRLQVRNRWSVDDSSLNDVVPFALVVGGLFHAFFETWLEAPGGAETFVFWTCLWLAAGGKKG
jgi:O-antigen ligase